jgi:hypothetical protein
MHEFEGSLIFVFWLFGYALYGGGSFMGITKYRYLNEWCGTKLLFLFPFVFLKVTR